ncbi:PLDc N-terminal domain-containing protein [Sphingobacterium rhinopitheci]|uniref:PLDc N-terminal domain-containing protein n=1 Tax=Sphingobacterium rhinopitheci TaxID=2781960 RepID=UPI001F5224EA|nr:PLDc N-terminal domain-containing protein [Sphingobacterium rhinopitheci]MCI0920330.1 PLDc N-terminal domain-containing protein [Sphingobacterium rhinopitheci]
MTSLFINIGVMEMLILLIILTPTVILPIYCMFDLFKRDFSKDKNQRILLILLLLLAPFIGSLIYLLALRKDYPVKHDN